MAEASTVLWKLPTPRGIAPRWRWWRRPHRDHRVRLGRYRRWWYIDEDATVMRDEDAEGPIAMRVYRLRRGRPALFVAPARMLHVVTELVGPYEETYAGTWPERWWAQRLLKARERRGATGERPHRRLYIPHPLQKTWR